VLFAANTLKATGRKVEEAGGDTREVLERLRGKQWVKEIRRRIVEVQTRYVNVKKVYEVAVEVEERCLKKRREGQELEYHKDFNRLQLMNI